MNPLTDLIPPRARKYVYAAGALAAFAYGIWEASGHDWRQALASLAASLWTALAHANTDPTPKPPQT